MDEENEDFIRRSEELEALKAFYGDDFVEHNRKESDECECESSSLSFVCKIRIRIRSSVYLEIGMPLDYPSRVPPTPKIIAPIYVMDTSMIKRFQDDLKSMYQEDTEVIIIWAEYLRGELQEELGEDQDHNSLLDSKEDNHDKHHLELQKANNSTVETRYACLVTHHLLDHKPDNLLRAGHKYGLRGYYMYGTPGVGVIWYQNPSDLQRFVDTLKSAMPQKKFSFICNREWVNNKCVDPKLGWNEINRASELKSALEQIGVDEEDYYRIFGLNPPTDPQGSHKKKHPKSSKT